MNKLFTLPAALILFLLVAPATLAHVRDTQSGLAPDLMAYCTQNLPHQLERQDNEWQVASTGAVGDSSQNNWQCSYQVYSTIPVFNGEDVGFMPLPSYTENDPVDWNALCNQQYPGAHAEWVPGPEVTTWGQPWQCVGKPGVVYDPAEQANGTHNILSDTSSNE